MAEIAEDMGLKPETSSPDTKSDHTQIEQEYPPPGIEKLLQEVTRK